MEKVKFYFEKYKLYIVIFITVIFLLFILFFLLFNEKEIVEAEEISIEEKREEKIETEKIRVDVKGYVEKEGVYEFDSNSRVIDAINKAGGLKKNANTDYINLSKN